MGIEPTMPLLSQSIIGFEDRGRHQSGTRFRRGRYTEARRSPNGCRHGAETGRAAAEAEEMQQRREFYSHAVTLESVRR